MEGSWGREEERCGQGRGFPRGSQLRPRGQGSCAQTRKQLVQAPGIEDCPGHRERGAARLPGGSARDRWDTGLRDTWEHVAKAQRRAQGR